MSERSVSDYRNELRNIFGSNNIFGSSKEALSTKSQEEIKKTSDLVNRAMEKSNDVLSKKLRQKQAKEKGDLETKQKEAITARVKISQQELKEVSQYFRRSEVNENNIDEVNQKIDELLKDNPEWIRENFDLKLGDVFTYNSKNKEMNILRNGKLVFRIRFMSYTKKELQEKAEIPRNNDLWNWIVKNGAYPGEKNSCGKSCWALLNAFWFRSILPQTGRDGKNWDSILEKYPVNQYFNKVAVSHPDKAPAGSVLVFNEWAKRWSSARKKYGHVEIKWANNNYYSYYESPNAGGSSRTAEKNPEKYKKETGFTGFAYVYNWKTPPDNRRRS